MEWVITDSPAISFLDWVIFAHARFASIPLIGCDGIMQLTRCLHNGNTAHNYTSGSLIPISIALSNNFRALPK